MTGAQALAWARPLLEAAGIEDAADDARVLLAHALNLPRERLTLHLPDAVEGDALDRFRALIAARADRVPVSHLTGRRLFWGRWFAVTPDVLDPRPETEVLVALALAQPFARVLDLGTGSGCILLSLLADRPGAVGTGVDRSAAALAVASRNAAALGVTADLGLGDWTAGLTGPYDLIVANPPYIAASEMPGLAPEVRDHEPRVALTDEGDGLAAYRAILARPLPAAPGARVLFEIGPTQGAQVLALMRQAGLGDLALHPDLDGRDRVAEGWWPA
jgi:release factor glutamine methyltransferase